MAAAGAPDVTSGEHEGPAPQEISARGYVRSWEEVAGRGTTLSTLLLQQLKANRHKCGYFLGSTGASIARLLRRSGVIAHPLATRMITSAGGASPRRASA